MSRSGLRVSIPNSMRNTIQNIKEITGNDSDEEIYAMLKECSMDPNETAQKLLLQDTFHEVKSKRDRRKEATQNLHKDPAESRWKPGMWSRGSRGGRANYFSCHPLHDAGGRNASSRMENGGKHIPDKGVTSPSLPISQEKKSKATSSAPSSVTSVANAPTVVASGSVSVVNSHHLSTAKVDQPEMSSSVEGGVQEQPAPNSSSHPVLLPSNDLLPPGTMGTIRHQVGDQNTPEQNTSDYEKKSTSDIGGSLIIGNAPSSSGIGKNQVSETSQVSSTSTHGGSAASRPSSNYSSRSQQTTGPIKVGSSKEWKPKPTNPNVDLVPATAGASEVPIIQVETSAQVQHVSSAVDSEKLTLKLEKLEEFHFPQRQHVILPNHIHVPKFARSKFSFGSFGANFGVSRGYSSDPESDGSPTPTSETSQVIEEAWEEQAPSNQNPSGTAVEADFPDNPQSPTPVPENVSSGDGDMSAHTAPVFSESKQDISLLSGGHQHSVLHTSPNYNHGFVPSMSGTQPSENSDSQARDALRQPSFVVQQPFDPTNYYAQFYRVGAENEGRASPFLSPQIAAKYSGGNSVVLHTAGPTALVTQAAGLMQSSLAMPQQPVPVLGPPSGMHISHYPPNYIPYGPYFSHPFYVQPPIHQFLGNGAFPHQPQASSLYPAPTAASATGVKYSFTQYKPGMNTGNTTHIGFPSGYGAYGSSPASYSPSSVSGNVNSTSNDDFGASPFKESNVYITGQQSDGSAVWVAAPGRDISGMPERSFYNLPPQGQHASYTSTQAGHGTFPGMYHPPQAVTSVLPLLQQAQTMHGPIDMVRPAASIYQQPQHAQINWPSNY